MPFCKVCKKSEALVYVLNNKLVCLKCDELTFDLEIEESEWLENEPSKPSKERPTPVFAKRGAIRGKPKR
jgi:hypothetical protein